MPKPNIKLQSASNVKSKLFSLKVLAIVLLASSVSIAKGELFGMLTVFDDDTSQLVSIDTQTGAATPVESILTPNEIWSMTYDPNTEFLIGIDTSVGSRLIGIDLVESQFGIIGDFGLQDYLIDAITYDPSTDTFFAIDFRDGLLIKIDRLTSTSTEIEVPGIQLGGGLAFDTSTDTLFGINYIPGVDDLAAIDPVTGLTTIIGPTGFQGIEGLTYDPGTELLYGADFVTHQLISIDPTTGVGTAIGAFDSLPLDNTRAITGLAYFPSVQVPEPTSLALLLIAGLGIVQSNSRQ